MKNLHLLLILTLFFTITSCTDDGNKMALPDSAAVSKKIHDAFSANRFDEVLSLASDSIEVRNYSSGQIFSGKEAFRNFLTGFKTAFPDIVIKHTKVMDDGKGNVTVEFEANGTHTGPLVGPAGTIPATGKTVKLNVCEVHHIENGKVRSIHNYQDSGSLLGQLGILTMPPTEETSEKN